MSGAASSSRGERLAGGLEKGLVGRGLGGGVAAAGDQRGQDAARLGEAHARAHARSAGRAGGSHDPRCGPVALAHRHRLAGQLRLRAQPRREREEGDEKAGDSRHENSEFGIRNSEFPSQHPERLRGRVEGIQNSVSRIQHPASKTGLTRRRRAPESRNPGSGVHRPRLRVRRNLVHSSQMAAT